jgi:hypothetical protein
MTLVIFVSRASKVFAYCTKKQPVAQRNVMDTNQQKARKPRAITSRTIDQESPAFRIVQHLGGLTHAAEIIDRSPNTVYGWLRRGTIPTGQQANVREKAREAEREFPDAWFWERAQKAA